MSQSKVTKMNTKQLTIGEASNNYQLKQWAEFEAACDYIEWLDNGGHEAGTEESWE